MIRTPDQRIRVFVSSTLRELAPERRAVRSAIEGLRLAPVMFELGARPHPPRDLYRAYLEQSDVFVGIYGDSYGWTAPGEAVSGLEDEYNLAPDGMPKLVYLKESSSREPGLTALIDRIKADDAVSYVSFSTPEQLAERVAADLATLLAERFDGARALPPAERAARGGRVPASYTEAIGREADVTALLELLVAELRAAGDPGRPRRDRQEPPRDRGGSAGGGRGGPRRVLRPARARHRPRPGGRRDRGRARRPRFGR